MSSKNLLNVALEILFGGTFSNSLNYLKFFFGKPSMDSFPNASNDSLESPSISSRKNCKLSTPLLQ